MLRDDRLSLAPLYDQIMIFRGSILETILFRDGPWQVELIAGMPHAGPERHRHLRCSSADLLLNGALPVDRVGRDICRPRRAPLTRQG